MGRPVGVTILAVLYFIGALFCVLGGILFFVGGGLGALAGAQSGQQGAAGMSALIGALGAFAGVAFLIIGVIYALLGWGMWKLKNWARIISIVLLVIGAAFQLFGLVTSFAHFSVFVLVWTLFWLAIDVLIIWYLLKPDVKAAFQRGQAGAAAA